MSPFQKFLYFTSKPLLARNKKFLNRYKGESCYIFGAGYSIRYFDLLKLPELNSIGINYFCVHKDYSNLNIGFHAIPQPYYFYPFYKTPRKKYIRNILAGLFQEILEGNPQTQVFTSLSNVLGYQGRQVHYMHHFGHRNPERQLCDISAVNSFMHAGLNAAVGVAINLGFEKAYLVGCDYLFDIGKAPHFFCHGPPVIIERDHCVYPDLLREASSLIDLELITDEGGSQWLPSQTYTEYTGANLKDQDNVDIVPEVYLDTLQKGYLLNQWPNPIYAQV